MILYFARHPTAANLLMLALIVLGLLTLPKLQRDTFPVIPATEVEVRLAYPGATPLDVEEAVCYRSEDALDKIAYLKEVRCDARENLAIITAQMEEQADMNKFYSDVKNAFDSISTFPDKVEPPTIEILERVAVVASIMISADTTDTDLKAYAEKVRQRIKQNRQIAQVDLSGFSDEDIVIEIPAHVQQRYGVGISDIKTAIEHNSIDIPSGTIESTSGDLVVRYIGQKRTPREFKEIIIASSKTGGIIKLGDIAKINKQFNKPEEQVIFNGKRAARLEISRNYTQDSLRVMQAIEQSLEREKRLAPKGVSLEISQDVTANIKERLRLLLVNGFQGIFLVFLTMWLFFSLRYSFWVSMGLPVSFLGTIFFMNLLGYSINMMTLVALLVAIGLLMDDAIVISENIAAKIRQGKNGLHAAVEGTRQVLPGVLSSFLTTIMIVGPLAFMSGKMGAVLKYIPAVLLIALAVSLIEAFLILPAHLNHSIKNLQNENRSKFHLKFDSWFAAFRDRYFASLLNKSNKQPYLTIGIIIALVLISFAMIPAGVLKYRALPILESDVIQARILLPQGSPLKQTEAVVEKLVSALKKVDKQYTPQQKSGEALVQNISIFYNTNIDAKESGTHIATVSADLLHAEKRSGKIPQLLTDWRNYTGDIAGVISLKFTDKERGIAGKAIDIRLHGNNLEMLKKASIDLQQWLKDFNGVVDVSDDLRPGKPEFRVILKETAGIFGITALDIAQELRSAIHGSTSLDVQSAGQIHDVVVKLADQDIKGLDDLYYLPVRSKSGQLVPLSAIAIIEEKQSYSRVFRVNSQRTITVQGALDTEVANAKEIMAITRSQFIAGLKKKYSGLQVSFVGQGKESSKTISSLGQNMFIGVIGVFIILSFQFKSYLQPIAILIAIPSGLIGVVWGHLLIGLELSMPSLVGLATLSGIVVNDSILLVAFIKNQHDSGINMLDAAHNAALNRFKAVILTSLTTIMGLLPLLLETSTQAQLLIPLVASLAFGLLTATMCSLLLIPAFFIVFEEMGWNK